MKTVELFCGTKSFSKVAERFGHETWTTDINPIFNPDHVGDIFNVSTQRIIKKKVLESHIVWMSPDCTKWSLSAGNTYWTEFRQPTRAETFDAIRMMMFCRYIADLCVKRGKIFYIENPNGRAVWIMDNQYLKRVWYCQYGDTRAKPTNLWTNHDISFKTCSNNNPNCHHERAKRGSRTGTQGLKNSIQRSEIPPKLFEHIFNTVTK